MKRTIYMFLIYALIITLFSPVSAFAVGDGNIDSGSGGMGSGTGASYWNPGDDGVRVTVVTKEGEQVTTPIDLTNIDASSIEYSFGKVSKISYRNGVSLTANNETYAYYNPVCEMKRIISSTYVKASLQEIKGYFTDKLVVQYIADTVGMDYDTLTNGDYKLLLEPIGYFHFNNMYFAMTATEAALYDQVSGGALYASMMHFTHMNLPLAMYLQVADLGFPAYNTGSRFTLQSDDTIIKELGVGIISFKNEVEKEESDANYEYRTDTDVITSIMLVNNGTDDVTPDNHCKVEFNILGKTYIKDFICPSEDKQLVWVKWHTPSTPQLVNIKVSGVNLDISLNITANIVELTENTPPDPQYGDTGEDFKLADTPDYGSSTKASWSVWTATWIPPVSVYDAGHWVFSQKEYSVSLNVNFTVSPDSRVQTATKRGSVWEMKSGYGVDADCGTSIRTSGGPSFSSDYTQAQTEIATFSDFDFKTYNRFLEPESSRTSTDWRFKVNDCSYYDCRVHFTPLWYPDDTDYVVAVSVFDVWTPVGMLYTTASDRVLINGSVYDDWYIRLME